MPERVPVAIYARISQDREGEEEGVDLQVKRCRAHAKKHNLDVVKILIDNDLSAYSRKPRPAFEELISMAEQGTIEGCVVRHVDRLYRRASDLEKVIDALDGADMTVYAVQSGHIDLSTADGRTYARAAAVFAAGEVEKQAERKADKFRQLAEEGKWKGGRRPRGFEADGVTIRESEAAALRAAAEYLLDADDPWSLNRITEWVSEQVGERIAPTTLRDVLLSPRIAGKRTYWSMEQRRAWAKKRKGNRVTGLPTDLPMYEAVWPAILPFEQWTDVVTLLTDPRRRQHAARPRKSLLAGLLICGNCQSEGRRSTLGYSRDSYKCPAKAQHGCASVTISTANIERHLRAKVTERLATMSDRTIEIIPNNVAAPFAQEWEDLERKRTKDIQLFDADIITFEELQHRHSKTKARMHALGVSEKERQAALLRGRRVFDAIHEWESAPTLAQAEIIKILISRVVISKATKRGRGFDYSRISIEWS